MKTKQILATFALLTAIMMAATFISCSKDDNPVNNNSFNEDDATLVTNDAELRDAIAKGKAVKLANDIQLSNSTLSIAEGTTVTIDLGGHTLDRGLKAREYNTGGQVITVRKGATLNLSNGTLTSGWGGDGGGINNEGGTANLTDVTITGCTGDDRGGAICNRSGSTLTMKGGSITGNTSNDHTTPEGGGGIFNAEGAAMTLANVTITGNEAKVKGGGGICNYGTLTIDSCTIQNNIAKMNGGGIWNGKDATLSINGGNISGNTANDQGGGIYTHSSFGMQGAVNISGNKRNDGVNNNVYLTPDAVITVTGSLENSSIGITMEKSTGTFTSGYNTKNSGTAPSTLFHADLPEVMAVGLDDNSEAQLANAIPDGDIYYIERSWDDASMTLKAEIKILKKGSYTVLNNGDDITLQPGYYVVKDNIEVDDIILEGSGEHHLILCDGANVEADILNVPEGQTAIIYGQTYNTGRLYIPLGDDDEFEREAAIGGRKGKACGTVIIHGGNIYAEGRFAAAGIGGGDGGDGGTVIIFGGNIEATGGGDTDNCGAGIGGGDLANGGTVTIYGGNVKADGNNGGAGIGSGNNASHGGSTGPLADESPITGGTINIYDGNIEAKGGSMGAGIGGGCNGGGAKVTINGGIVKAWGNEEAAGIGTGSGSQSIHFTGELTVNAGEVYAYGGDDGAGIGGGWDTDGGTVTVNGGYVYAKGNGNGAGIGSGSEALTSGGKQGGSLTVTGGRVEAYGGEDAAGIGGGEDADGGTVNISGGYVYAKGSYGGAGIGGGEGGDGAKVTITGGTVHASAGSGDTGNRAIGPGYGCDAYGSLTLGDLLMVRAERMAVADERVPMCWYRTDVHVEPCTHPGYTAETCPYHKTL